MTKESIDEFLLNNKKIEDEIKEIAKNYKLSDFVKVGEECREYFLNHGELDGEGLYGCIYNQRKDFLVIDVDSVQQRLTSQYLELLRNLFRMEDSVDKVFYIVAYHYLTLCKQWGYKLTEADGAPFTFMGTELSPRGKKNYKKYKEAFGNELYGVSPYLNVEDITYYNRIYRECGYHHHATKHFSLIDYVMNSGHAVDRYDLRFEFKQLLDAFVFRYKAIYTLTRLGIYMGRDTKEKVKASLIDVI